MTYVEQCFDRPPPVRRWRGEGLGAVSSFEELYGAHFDRLTLQLYAYIGDIAQAQDVVQEASAGPCSDGRS
jgi:RNA polymerase sigma-70 factor (ECF subfamily)